MGVIFFYFQNLSFSKDGVLSLCTEKFGLVSVSDWSLIYNNLNARFLFACEHTSAEVFFLFCVNEMHVTQ
jgi:hypothetical protein